ncbi:MAG: hypothetical protein M3552_07855, partial [Planctomycetota bacterium]|nr:hypothetical protein [Planctomycetota bacterium]
MQPPVSEEHPLAFKFQWMNDQGQATGFMRKKGRFDGTTLKLDKTDLPAALVLGVVTRGERMVLSLPTQDGQVTGAGIVLTSKKITDRLKEALDIARSATWAEHHRQQLVEKGRGHTYRDAKCPNCAATVVVSDMPKTPQLYCTFCETLSFTDRNDIPVEQLRDYRLCDDCGMFSKPRKF